jgi:hypothetical protein
VELRRPRRTVIEKAATGPPLSRRSFQRVEKVFSHACPSRYPGFIRFIDEKRRDTVPLFSRRFAYGAAEKQGKIPLFPQKIFQFFGCGWWMFVLR